MFDEISSITKVLNAPKQRGVPRKPEVTKEEWSKIFSEYASDSRWFAANMAAHNWDVFILKGRIGVSATHNPPRGYWLQKEGPMIAMTAEELDIFYPIVSPEKEHYIGFFREWGRGLIRQETLVLPINGDTENGH